MADWAGAAASANILAVVGNVGRGRGLRLEVWLGRIVMTYKLLGWAAGFMTVAALCYAFYEAGQKVGESRAKVQIIEKQVEVVKYVEKKKALIQSRPNAGRDDLLERMRNGKL